MKRRRYKPYICAVGCFILQGCEPLGSQSSRASSERDTGGPVDNIAGIYAIVSRVENTEACSLEGAKPKARRKQEFFFVAPDTTPDALHAGALGSCETLEACKEAARLYLRNHELTTFFGGTIDLKDDGTLELPDPFPRMSLNEPPEDRCDVIWSLSTVTWDGRQLVYREEDHLAEFPKPEGHQACRIEGLERARAEPCGRLRVTTGKRVADLPLEIAKNDHTADAK